MSSLKSLKNTAVWEVVKLAHKQQMLGIISPYYCGELQLFSLREHVPVKIGAVCHTQFWFPFCPHTMLYHKEAAM